MMDFVIQCNMLSNDLLEQVREAVIDLPHKFVGLIPFGREITSNEPIVGLDHIPYGNTSFVETTSELGWKGLSFDKQELNYRTATLRRDDMLNNGQIMTAQATLNSLMIQEDDEEKVFMRPSEDLKIFSGAVLKTREAIEFLQRALECSSSDSYKIDPATMIVTSAPKNIMMEWRWFIVNGRVIDGSMYRCNGELKKKHVTDASEVIMAQSLADKWLPAPCCVMDTCMLSNGVTKVVEFNCINGSGFYDNDVGKVMTHWWRYWND